MSRTVEKVVISKPGFIEIPENTTVSEPVVLRCDGGVLLEVGGHCEGIRSMQPKQSIRKKQPGSPRGDAARDDRQSISIHAYAHSTATIHWFCENTETPIALEIKLETGARISLIKIQKNDMASNCQSTVHVLQAAQSIFSFGQLLIGGSETDDKIHVELQGEGASVELFGLYLPAQKQKMHLELRVDHAAPKTKSQQYYKGVLKDESFVSWASRVHVHPSAKGSESKQKNQTLLLSSKAEIQAKPELEIDQDDVKCAHGATVGQLDAEALFYLQSRGIPEVAARELLIEAFTAELMERLKCELL